MKFFLTITSALLLTNIAPLIAQANDKHLTLIEIFTYPESSGACGEIAEDEYHHADGSHKEGTPEDHIALDRTESIPQKDVEEIFTELLNENPNLIALNYKYKFKDTVGDIENTKKLNQLFNKRNYLYYRTSDMLDQQNPFQIVIGGEIKSNGTMKHVVDSAIKLYQSQPSPTPIQLKIEGTQLQIEMPETATNKQIPLTLIGYNHRTKIINENPLEPVKETRNIVSHSQLLENWKGEERKETISISDINADGFVLIAQDQKTAKILAIGKVEKPLKQAQ